MKIDFKEYEGELWQIILGENHDSKFLELVDHLHKLGHPKEEIYNLFGDFLIEIQIDPRTKGDEVAYDNLLDFMDGFTVWGKAFRILPDEPDV
ncbi:MAG: hypothetical protein AAF587_00425 [Bacteroidota bacterium]